MPPDTAIVSQSTVCFCQISARSIGNLLSVGRPDSDARASASHQVRPLSLAANIRSVALKQCRNRGSWSNG